MDSDTNRPNHVNYLIEAASLLPSETYFHKLLRSYYLTKCKRLAQTDDKRSKTIFSEEEMCKKCSTPWFDTNYSLSIAPIKTTKRKARKIHKQIEEKYKRKNHLAKKLSKKVNNIMTVKCYLCNAKNKIILWKKSSAESKQSLLRANDKMIEINEPTPNKTEPQKKAIVGVPQELPKKKKRKKDKTAGLSYSMNKDDCSVKKITKINQKLQTLNIQKTPSASSPSNKSMNQPLNKNKNKGKPNESKVKSKNNLPKNVKNQQPAVKRNSLLQLANALKAKGNQSGANSQADKLKQLLR